MASPTRGLGQSDEAVSTAAGLQAQAKPQTPPSSTPPPEELAAATADPTRRALREVRDQLREILTLLDRNDRTRA